MKPVPGETEEGARPPRKRRRHATRSPSVDPPATATDDIDESARPPPARPSYVRDEDNPMNRRRRQDEGEELVINWTTTSPRLAARLLTLKEDRLFREKMFAALEEDEPLDALEAQYGFTVPSRWRPGGHDYASGGMAKSGLEGMEEEEYCEYVRKNMWRRTHREEVAAMEAREKETKRKERELKEAKRKAAEERREKDRKDKEKAARHAQKERKKHRDAYVVKWATLNDASQTSALRFSDIPWPAYPPNQSFSLEAVSDFLLDHLGPDTTIRREALRTAIRTYHPDRFERHLIRLPEETGERAKARDIGLRVSQILNEMNEAANTKDKASKPAPP